VPSSAGRRGGGATSAAARGTAGCGDRRRLGRARRRKHQRRRGRGRPREAHAAAHHIRIVPVDVPSKADQPRELRLVALLSGLVHGLAHRVAHRGLGTAGTHLFCAAVASSAVAARESWPTSFPDTQSERKSGSRGPKGATHATCSARALRGTGRALELATRASAHEHAMRSQSRTSRGTGARARVGLLAVAPLLHPGQLLLLRYYEFTPQSVSQSGSSRSPRKQPVHVNTRHHR